MTDSLKFGPEWLRNLSQDGHSTGTGGGGPRYQLAEHRYGREEMLALFDRSLGQPDLLGRFKSLYVERLQLPLALVPTQEEENRGWLPRPMTGGLSGVRGGRGGVSVDRGRGRGGRGLYHSQGVSLSAPYQRSQSSFETDEVGMRVNTRPTRPWSEQNGEAEWNGSTSPRKEYSATGRANMDNWRRHRGMEDDDGWRSQPEQRRPEKWTRGGGTAPSWRDGDAEGAGGDRELARGFERLERELRERGLGGGSERGDRPPPTSAIGRSWNARKPWDVDDILPEWAMENPSESGGTFDASGAFHGSDDEQERAGRLNHSHSTTSMQSPRPAPLSRSQTQGSIAVNKHNNSGSIDNSKNRLKEHPGPELSHSEEELYHHRKEDQRKTSSARNSSKPDREISIEHLDQEPKLPQQQQQQTSTQNNSNSKSNNHPPEVVQKSEAANARSGMASPAKNVSQHSTPKKSAKESDSNTKNEKDDRLQKMDSYETDKNSLDSKNMNEDLSKSKLKHYVSGGSQEEEMTKKQETPKQSPHDEFDIVADDIVAQLMMDEERSPVVPPYQGGVAHSPKLVVPGSPLGGPAMVAPPSPNVHNVMPIMPQQQQQQQQQQAQQPVVIPGADKWFYRDPQGEVQGPFLANEMGEWYRAGYFTNELLVRRACDERYTTLGELVKVCGGVVPFSPSARLPPLKVDPSMNNAMPPAPAGGAHPGMMPGGAQYRQAQLLSRQIAARHEAQAQVLRELSRSERWGTMTPAEQNAVLMQHLAQIPFPDTFAPPPVPAGLGIPPIVPMTQPTPAHNPLLQLISQMQQAKPSSIMSQVPTIDPTMKQQSPSPHMNHMSGLAGHPNIPMPAAMNHNASIPNHIAPPLHHPAAAGLNQVLNPSGPMNAPDQMNQNVGNVETSQKSDDLMSMFKQFFTKMGNNKPAPEGGSWNPSWNATNNIASMWDMQVPKPSEMKTEQQILEEQLRLRKEAEEQELREKEQKRQQEEALAKTKQQQEKAKKQAEIEEKMKAQKEAEEKQKDEQKRKELEKKKAEEKEKRDAERIKKELEKARREAEEKRLRELEEKRRLKEERKREEEQRKESDQRRKLEEAQQQRTQQEEEARRLVLEQEDMKRKATEAKKSQERQATPKVAPWRPPADPTVAPTSSLNLAEIQRLEREKRAEQLKEQAQQQALRNQQAALAKEQELAAANERSAMQLKWASQKPQVSNKVKSLAEIQAEEMAKQAAADRLAAQQRERESPVIQQTPSIWSSATSLNWTSTAWTSNTGFWDETPAPASSATVTQSKPQMKSSAKVASSANANSINQNKSAVSNKLANSQNTTNHNGGQKTTVSSKQEKNTATNINNNLSKKKKKDEKDDFTNWCTKAMSSINSSVDVPTFIGFLNDIDSPFEVKDYIRTYLGDSKDAVEFSKQFLERRSRFRSQQRLAAAHIDDMCSPAPAINPGSEFHEGKSKKSKKNKMQKIDSRILGFNVTAAQDRINIGDRDYGDTN